MRSQRVLASLSASALFLAGGFLACVGDDPTGSTPPVSNDGSTSADGPTSTPDSGTPTDSGGDVAVDAGPPCDASPCIVQISAGGAHTCARAFEGTVRCWGTNRYGECGGGTVYPAVDGGNPDESVLPATYATPNLVATISGASVIGAGGSYRAYGISCAATGNLTMSCWGMDKSQQLGRGGPAKLGDTTPAPARPEPAPVVQLTNVKDISVGVRHACAVFTGGAVACWGADLDGALGIAPIVVDGKGTTYGTPQTLAVANKFTRVVSRGQHNLALTDDGKVWAWGDNGNGQHGVATGSTTWELPSQVAALAGKYIDIAAGRFHSCALDETGKIWCWGKGSDGQLGRGQASLVASAPTPALVTLPLGSIATQISGDEQHMAALFSDGTVREWGTTVVGFDGDTRGTTIDTPALVTLPKKATQVSAGYEHTCAVLEGGAVWCWGNNRSNELGRGAAGPDGGIHSPGAVAF